MARSFVLFASVLVALFVTGCPGRECFRAVRCVASCGGPVVSTGCGPCGAGTFDDFLCAADAGPADGGPAPDGGPIDGGPAPDGGPIDGGPAPDAGSTACSANSECALRGETCCGVCGSSDLADYVALHEDDVAGYGTAVCTAEGFPPCALCDLGPAPQLFAVCEEGACIGGDITDEPLTECTVASDCVLAARQCCDCGLLGERETVAYNPARGSTSDYFCDEGAPACPPCVPTFESGLAPGCVDGRCVVFGPD